MNKSRNEERYISKRTIISIFKTINPLVGSYIIESNNNSDII